MPIVCRGSLGFGGRRVGVVHRSCTLPHPGWGRVRPSSVDEEVLMGAAQKQSGSRKPNRVAWWVAGILGGALIVFVGLTAGSPRSTTATDPATIAAGEVLYLDNCAVCHGTDLMGTTTGPPFLNVIYAPNHHSDEAFQQAVAAGVIPHHWNFGAMAPLPHLSRDEVAKIVAFVRAEQQAAGITRDPSHP